MKILNSVSLNERVFYDKLPNGMQVFYMPKKGFTKKYAVMSANFGSNDLEFISPHTGEKIRTNEGVAHFLEHKMFAMEDGTDAFEYFNKIGALSNAYTNFNITSYLFLTADNFYSGLKHLINFVGSPYFTEENVEKEKGIIAQEIKMYDDEPSWRLFFNALKIMYINHNNRIDIAGDVESIYKITPEELYMCYNSFYSPSNMSLFIAGDLNADKIFETVYATVKNDNMFEGKIRRIQKREPNEVKEHFISEKAEVSIPMALIAFKDKIDRPEMGLGLIKKIIETELIMDILFKKGSDLHEKLYSEKLIYSPLQCEYTVHTDYGYSAISFESRETEKVLSEIKETIENAQKNGISKTDFERNKKGRLGSYIKMFDSIETTANFWSDLWFKGVNLFDFYDVIRKTTLKDVNRRLKNHFDYKMSVVSLIEPLNEK